MFSENNQDTKHLNSVFFFFLKERCYQIIKIFILYVNASFQFFYGLHANFQLRKKSYLTNYTMQYLSVYFNLYTPSPPLSLPISDESDLVKFSNLKKINEVQTLENWSSVSSLSYCPQAVITSLCAAYILGFWGPCCSLCLVVRNLGSGANNLPDMVPGPPLFSSMFSFFIIIIVPT